MGEPKLFLNERETATQYGLVAFFCFILGILALGLPSALNLQSREFGLFSLVISTSLVLYGIVSALKGVKSPKEKGVAVIVLLMLLGYGGILALIWFMFITGSHGVSPYM